MTVKARISPDAAIDPAFIAAIVQRVLARLQAETSQPKTTKTEATAASIGDKVVTAARIEKVPATPSQVFVTADSVVTPAAYDAARARGIEINRSIGIATAQQANAAQPVTPSQQANSSAQEITDTTQPERATALQSQLARRGINNIGSRLILSDRPAAELYHRITTESCRAAMVACIADVDRCERDLHPQAWVLDMGSMNFVTAVNVAARIALIGN